MEPTRVLPIISVFSLITVEYGGYALLGFLTSSGGLGEFRERFFRAGHAHAGVLLVLSLVYFIYLDRTNYSRGVQWVAGGLLLVGILSQSGGFFLHLWHGEPGQRSVGTLVTAGGRRAHRGRPDHPGRRPDPRQVNRPDRPVLLYPDPTARRRGRLGVRVGSGRAAAPVPAVGAGRRGSLTPVGGGLPAPGRGVDPRRRCSSRRHQPVQPPAAPGRGAGSETVTVTVTWRMLSSLVDTGGVSTKVAPGVVPGPRRSLDLSGRGRHPPTWKRYPLADGMGRLWHRGGRGVRGRRVGILAGPPDGDRLPTGHRDAAAVLRYARFDVVLDLQTGLIPGRNRDGSLAICQTSCMGADGPTLRILGALELLGPAGPVRLGAAKERCLLAVLALHPGEVVSQDQLAEALWGEQPPRSAANALQNYVLRLRRALRAAEGVQILTDPAGYRLQAPADMVDMRLAERLIAEGREAAAAGDPATAARLLREALALWRGRALAEFSDQPFAQAEAARLEELRESAREDLAEVELALGRHHDLVGELEAMVASHPLRERRWGQLLLARYRDGRQAEALDGFRALRTTLRDELGVDPSPELQDLHDRVLRQDPALAWWPPEPAPASVAAPWYGRDEELRRLLGVYDTAAAGGGGVVTVVGEPGIGKTRLLQELAASARRRGGLVLSGRCLEGAWVPPYQAFVEAITGYAAQVGATRLRADLGPAAGPLAQLVPALRERLRDLPTAAPLQPDEERLRLLDAVARFLAGLTAHGPVVLMLDDLHWADASTLVTLRHVARVAARQRLLLVGAYRSGEAGPDLVDALGALRAEAQVTTLHLRGLATHALGRMLGALADAPVSAALAGAIQHETRGNPFFAREVLRHLLETQALQPDAEGALQADVPLEVVPEGLRDVLARRRARLSPEANRFLDTAAGFEGPFPFAVVVEVAKLEDATALAALDELLQAGLVESDMAPEHYQFGHALIRHAVYTALNPSRRVRLHRRLAHALQAARAVSPARVAAGEVAAQYQRSAVLPGAEAGVAPALEAAEQAQAASAYGEAASFLTVACELAPPGDARLPRLRARLGLALAWALRLDEAVQVACQAADELAAVESRQAAAGYLAEVASAFINADSVGHAWQLVPQGLAYADERRDGVWASLTLLELDRREAADPEYPGVVLDVPERREALRILHRAGALAGRVDLLRYAVAAIYGTRQRIPPEVAEDSTVQLFLLGDYAAALPRFAAEATEAHARGQLAREAYCHGNLARCHVALGQLEAGRAALAECHAVADRIAAGPWGWQRVHAIAGTDDALVLATDEGWEDLLSLLAEFSGTRGQIVRWAQSGFDAVMARAQARLGRPDRALQLLAAALPALQRGAPWDWTFLRTACDAAETLWLLDRRDHLSVIEAALRDKVLPGDFRFPMMDARLALARLCALDDRRDEASQWFAKARTVLDAQGTRPLRAIVDFDEALMHRRAGRHDAARPLLDAAVDQFARLGMTGWLRRAGAVGAAR